MGFFFVVISYTPAELSTTFMVMLYAKHNPRRASIGHFIALVAVLFLLLLLPLIIVGIREYPRYTRSLQSVSDAPVAIIFGAATYPNGQLSPFLQDRVEGGIALYQQHKVNYLLMTGDHRSSDYNEPKAMATYAIAHGVPEAAIVQDGRGIDTNASCQNAYSLYAVRKAVLVTQGYHEPRALALCRAAGIDATGYSVTNWHQYAARTVQYIAREVLSMFKAGYDILQEKFVK